MQVPEKAQAQVQVEQEDEPVPVRVARALLDVAASHCTVARSPSNTLLGQAAYVVGAGSIILSTD